MSRADDDLKELRIIARGLQLSPLHQPLKRTIESLFTSLHTEQRSAKINSIILALVSTITTVLAVSGYLQTTDPMWNYRWFFLVAIGTLLLSNVYRKYHYYCVEAVYQAYSLFSNHLRPSA